MAETAQVTLQPDLHSGDFLHCQIVDQSTSNTVQSTTAVPIETSASAAHITTTIICQAGVLETASVSCADTVSLISQKHFSPPNVERVKTAEITGSGLLHCSTPWRLPYSFFGRVTSHVIL